jgi:hypothetical protein
MTARVDPSYRDPRESGAACPTGAISAAGGSPACGSAAATRVEGASRATPSAIGSAGVPSVVNPERGVAPRFTPEELVQCSEPRRSSSSRASKLRGCRRRVCDGVASRRGYRRHQSSELAQLDHSHLARLALGACCPGFLRCWRSSLRRADVTPTSGSAHRRVHARALSLVLRGQRRRRAAPRRTRSKPPNARRAPHAACRPHIPAYSHTGCALVSLVSRRNRTPLAPPPRRWAKRVMRERSGTRHARAALAGDLLTAYAVQRWQPATEFGEAFWLRAAPIGTSC